jgi:hypothetical protein
MRLRAVVRGRSWLAVSRQDAQAAHHPADAMNREYARVIPEDGGCVRKFAIGLGLTALLALGVSTSAAGGAASIRFESQRTLPSRDCVSSAWSGSALVPNIVSSQFDRAVSGLLAQHLRISVPRFVPFRDAPAEQGWGRLENYQVVAQSPAPGKHVNAGTAVVLRLSDPVFHGPLGSMVEPLDHPKYARIPHLVGRTYQQAMAAASPTSGVLVRVSQTGPLDARASVCGLNAFVVASQAPRPGTRVPWGGVKRNGVAPALATVTITLVSRRPH